MMAEIDNLSISIEASAGGAITSLNRLASALMNVQSIINGFTAAKVKRAFDSVRKSADKAAESVDKMANSQERAQTASNNYNGSSFVANMNRSTAAVNNTTTALARLVNAIGSANRAQNYMYNWFRNVGNANPFRQSPFLLKGQQGPIYTSFVDDGNDTIQKDQGVRSSSESFQIFTGILNRFKSKLQEVKMTYAEFAKSLTKLPLQSIKGALIDLPKYFGGNLVSGIKNATNSLSVFFASIKRIAFYRLIRTVIKEITKGLSEGLKNLYHWSETINGTFYKSMNQMATASNYLKNSFAAMVSPLIESLAPAIDLIVDKFVDMFNIVNQVFALLTGKTTYTAAKKVATEWDEESKKANKSAKELKATLLGFDEINRLNGDTNGSGSSGKKAKDYSNMFETRNISSWITDMVNSGDFSLLGKTVANKINDALSSINWDSVKSKAVGFVDSITSLINGFISDIDGNTLGTTLAEVINTVTTSIDRLWSKVNWAEAGRKLHDVIVQFFNNIGVEKAANALTGKFKSIVTLIKNALPTNIEEWDKIGKKISTFIGLTIDRISKSELGEVIGNLLLGGLRLVKILADDMTLTKVATAIKGFIEDACSKITPEEVKSVVESVLKDVLKAVGVLLSIEIDFGDVKINPILLMAFAGTAVNLIKTAIGNIFGATTVGGLGSSLFFAAGITLGINAVVQLLDIIDGIKNGEGIDWSKVGDFISSAAMSTGMFLFAKGNFLGGAVAIAIGLVAKPVLNKVMDIFADIKENGFTLESLWGILETVGGTGIIFAGIGLIKTLFGLKLGMSSVAVEAASGGLGGFVNMAGFTSSFMGVLRKFFATSLGSSFASLGIVGGGIVLGMGIAVAIGLTPEIDAEYSKKVFKNDPTSPTSIYSTAEMGGNLYGQNNPAQLKYLPSFENDYTMVMDVGVNFTSADNPTYKNKTLGDYIKDAMKKVHPEVFTRVSAVAGSLMQKASNALKPLIDNMTSTDTVEGNPGTAMEWSKGNVSALAPIVNGVSSLDIVNAAAGVGMSGTNSYSLSAITSDTTSTNTVNASAGSGMTSLTNGLQANVSDVTATATIDAKTPWGTFGGAGGVLSHVASTYAVLSTLGINDLYTDVDVGLHRNWWGDPISTLGLNNLFATIYVGIRKAAGSSVTFVPTAGKNGSIVLRKHGGIFSGGFWRDIPQYAGGTTSAHGSMFIAGENGPEVVGHIGGRTEVLNKSQLASAMYSAVHSAMSGVSLDADFHGGSIGNGSEFAEYASKEHEDMRQQNDLLRQQNELLRMLYEKDNEWSTSGLSKAQAYVNRRAGTTIIPVGT